MAAAFIEDGAAMSPLLYEAREILKRDKATQSEKFNHGNRKAAKPARAYHQSWYGAVTRTQAGLQPELGTALSTRRSIVAQQGGDLLGDHSVSAAEFQAPTTTEAFHTEPRQQKPRTGESNCVRYSGL